MDWKSLDNRIESAENVIFPKVLESKNTPHMTNEELCLMIHGMFNVPKAFMPETDKPENKEFMEEACDAWGNNGEPIQPEDCDTDSVHNE